MLVQVGTMLSNKGCPFVYRIKAVSAEVTRVPTQRGAHKTVPAVDFANVTVGVDILYRPQFEGDSLKFKESTTMRLENLSELIPYGDNWRACD